MKALHEQRVAVAIHRDARHPLDRAVKQAIAVGIARDEIRDELTPRIECSRERRLEC